ncbi:MAG: J domain-containing protein [Desulfuromonadales bacterium]|nr:J domain-containing protein [Desulfuromonadales bacterium]
MHFPSETALFNACRTLFGREVNLSHEFLSYLQPSGAKTAFRSQAKAHHPDAHANSSTQVRKQQTERFREIRQAYDLIIEFLEKRQRTSQAAPGARPAQPAAHRGSGATRQRSQQKPRPRASSIPSIPLEFGMFTYYQGKVSYQQLIEALVWQRRQRPTLGVIAQKWGWLSDGKVGEILGHRGHAVRFGKKAVELGYLKPHQVEALLQHQRSLQLRIGQYFIEKGLLTEEEADQIAQSLEAHNGQVSLRAQSRAGLRR